MSGVTLSDPGGDGQPEFTGQMFRAMLSAFLNGSTTRAFGASSGVAPRTPSSVVSVTPTVWTVNPHAGILDVSASGTDGPTPYAFLTAQTGAINAASASNDRVDLLVVQLSDPAEGDGSAHPSVDIKYQAGVAGSGVPTNTQPRSFVLAWVNVPRATTGSPTVTWVAPRCVAAGGIRPVSGSSQYPGAPWLGQYVDDAAKGLLRYDGSGWSTPIIGDGWHNLALDAGFNDGAGSAQYRSNGLQGYLRGRIAKNSGADFATGAGIEIAAAGAIPASARPARSMAYPVTNPGSARTIRATVGADGSVTVYTTDSGVGLIDLAGAGGWFVDA